MGVDFHNKEIQQILDKRIEKTTQEKEKMQNFYSRALVSPLAARLLRKRPELIAAAVNAFYYRDFDDIFTSISYSILWCCYCLIVTIYESMRHRTSALFKCRCGANQLRIFASAIYEMSICPAAPPKVGPPSFFSFSSSFSYSLQRYLRFINSKHDHGVN